MLANFSACHPYIFLHFCFLLLLKGDCQFHTSHYGVSYVSKLKNKRVFIYPARNIQIQCKIYKSSQVGIYIYIQHRIYVSSQGYIYPARDLYIQPGIYISRTGYIYPAKDLSIQPGIYTSSTGFIYPVRDIYITHGIYKSSQGFIYPARDLYIPYGIYHLWSQNMVTCYPCARM